jgi:hypothetical protein
VIVSRDTKSGSPGHFHTEKDAIGKPSTRAMEVEWKFQKLSALERCSRALRNSGSAWTAPAACIPTRLKMTVGIRVYLQAPLPATAVADGLVRCDGDLPLPRFDISSAGLAAGARHAMASPVADHEGSRRPRLRPSKTSVRCESS